MADESPDSTDEGGAARRRAAAASKPSAGLADRVRARWIAYRQSPTRLSFDALDLATARAIALTERLRGLRQLNVRALPDEPTSAMLLCGTTLPRLTTLEVSDYHHRIVVDGQLRYCPPREQMNPLRDAAHFAADLAAVSAPSLERLEMTDMGIGDDGIGLLADAPTFAAVGYLRLSDIALGDEGARHLAAGPWSESLHELHLSHASIGDAGIQALARAPWAKGLRRLGLVLEDLGATGVAALNRCTELVHLSLGGPLIDDGAAEAIASTKHPRLERLDLSRTAVGARGAAAIARSQRCFPALTYLSLADCPLDDDGKEVLAKSRWLRHDGNQCYRTRAGQQAAAHDRQIMDIAAPKT